MYFKPLYCYSSPVVSLFCFWFCHLKIVALKEDTGANCRTPGLCQIYIKGETELCCEILPLSKYQKDSYYIS